MSAILGGRAGRQIPQPPPPELAAASKLPLRQAITTLEYALSKARAAKNPVAANQILEALGHDYDRLGKLTLAERAYEDGRKLCVSLGDRERQDGFLDLEVEIYLSRKMWSQAKRVVEKIAAPSLQTGELRAAWSSYGLFGLGLVKGGRYQEAYRYANLAMGIAHRLKSTKDEILFAVGFGVLLQDQGLTHEAITWMKRGLAISRSAKIRWMEAACLHNLASASWTQEGPQKALASLDEAIKIERDEKNYWWLGNSYNLKGKIFTYTNNYAEALVACQESVNQFRIAGKEEDRATALNGLGNAREAVGDFEGAEKCYREELEVFKAAKNPNGQALALGSLGTIYQFGKSDLRGALAAYRAGLKMRTADDETGLLSEFFVCIGSALLDLKQYRECLEYLDKAYALTKADPWFRANILSMRGEALEGVGRFKEALSCLNRCIIAQLQETDRLQTKTTLHRLSQFWWRRGRPKLAVAYGKLGINLIQSIRSDNRPLGKKLLASYQRRVEGDYRDLANILIVGGRLPEAQQVLDLLKDDEFQQFMRVRGTPKELLDLTPQEKEWTDLYTSLGSEIAKSGSEVERVDRIPPAVRSQADAESLSRNRTRLRVASKAFDRFLEGAASAWSQTSNDHERLNDLRGTRAMGRSLSHLPNHPVAIYTLTTKSKVWLVYSGPNLNIARHGPDISEADLNRKIEEFRRVLGHPGEDPKPAASDLYDILVRPIEGDLKAGGNETIMWSLDSTLRYVPMWALYDRVEGKYFVEKYASSIFTPRNVDRLIEAPRTDWTLSGFGVTKGRTEGGDSFGDLNSVSEELQGAMAVLGGKVKLNDEFTLESLQSGLDEHSAVLHLATHFRLKWGDEAGSYLLMGKGKLTVQDFKRSLIDGSLNYVDLLVLSACETALGDGADGSEFEGLARLAQDKGAAAVISTLWSVDDKSTALLMEEFYRLRKAHPDLTKLEALRNAQLKMLHGEIMSAGKDYAHPYYWAPFELIGNWR